MQLQVKPTCSVATLGALLLVSLTASDAKAQTQSDTDLLLAGPGAWCSPEADLWGFDNQQIQGHSPQFGAPRKAPESSAWLLTKQVFDGDNVEVHIEVTFSHGRYLGLYMDYDQETNTGIWMSTGHPNVDSDKHMQVEAAYIKTVEKGDWLVRTEGELIIENGIPVHLVFAKQGNDYSIYENDRLVITYRKPGYAASPLQLRIVDADIVISRLEVKSDGLKVVPGRCS